MHYSVVCSESGQGGQMAQGPGTRDGSWRTVRFGDTERLRLHAWDVEGRETEAETLEGKEKVHLVLLYAAGDVRCEMVSLRVWSQNYTFEIRPLIGLGTCSWPLRWPWEKGPLLPPLSEGPIRNTLANAAGLLIWGSRCGIMQLYGVTGVSEEPVWALGLPSVMVGIVGKATAAGVPYDVDRCSLEMHR